MSLNAQISYFFSFHQTMARNCIRQAAAQNPKVEKLLPLCVGNIGFVFTNDDAKVVRDLVLSCRVPAAAKPGAISPVDVYVPAGPTGMDPSQTGFFQALNIATKIVKGAIEIISEVHLLKPGDKVGNSEVILLNKLNIRPFSYGLKIVKVYEDGATYDSEVLDLTSDALLAKFFNGVGKVAAVSLAINYPTAASLPHSIANGFLKMLSISLATEYTFEQAQKFKDMLANPGLYAAAAPAAGGAAPAAAAAAKEEAPAEDEDDALDGGFSMFD
jgi:large subunit ribosomal protein LP0